MNFNDFWKWLCKRERLIQNLGKRGQFKIRARCCCGYCCPQAKKSSVHLFCKHEAQIVWDYYQKLLMPQQGMAGHYTAPKMKSCPNQTCSPWIAAAIRDFLAGQK